MSGYDALDELYERLRGAEDARRAGGITPETIRAARGGVADGHGRECRAVDENAADGDSEPLAGDSRDSRERIEADLEALTKRWHDYDGDFMKIYSSVAYAQVKELLDRQAALTEREHPGLTISDDESLINWHGENYLLQSRVLNAERERDEFSLKLKHEMELNRDNRNAFDLERIAELRAELAELRPSRTVEDVLSEFASRVLNSGHQWGLDAPDVVPEYAAEIRELMGVGA